MQATRQFNTHPPALCAGKAPDEKLQIGAIKFLTIGAPFLVKTPSRWGNQISVSINRSHHPPNKEIVGDNIDRHII